MIIFINCVKYINFIANDKHLTKSI